MGKRRSPGEGGISSYPTGVGERWLVTFYVTDPATGARRRRLKRGFTTKRAAGAWLRDTLSKVERGDYVDPSKQRLDDYLAEWLDGLRVRPSTVASYRKNVRLHIAPHLGALPLSRITPTQLNAWLRKLETAGRADGQGGLSPRTVRYVFTILRSALGDAVKHGRLVTDPTDRANPPSATEARAPEMVTWTAAQLSAFLDWTRARGDELHFAWLVLAVTGLRRGELLALRWSDIDLDAARIAVRRSVGVVRHKGAGEELVESLPKSGRARVVDLDEQTVAALRAYRLDRASVSLTLARDDALVFGTIEGATRHPERFSRGFSERLARYRRELGDYAPPAIRVHDLRHTHATLLLAAGVPVKVVSERLGHANPTITLGVYAHVMPGMGSEAAARFAALVYGGQ